MSQDQSRTDAIPAGGILLHIGPHKTGTSALQAALNDAKTRLQQQGVENVVAGIQRQTANRAARALQRLPYRGPRESPAVKLKIWTNLVEKIKASKAERIVISGEEFSASPPGAIRKITSDLGARRLHVVITLRSLDKVLLSQWQQDIRSAWTYLKFEPWLKATLRDARDQYRIGPLSIRHRFWYRHRHDELIKRWVALVGKERVHIVIVRDYDLDFLYHSFESLLELKSSTLVSNSERQHQSLGADQIEVFRQVVRLLHRTVAGQALLSSKRLHLNKAVEQAMPAQDQRVQLEIPACAVSDIQTISEDIREAVMSGGYNVIGSAVDLAPSKAAASTSQGPRFSEGELNRFAIQAYNLLLMREPFTPIREASWLTL